MSGMYAPNQQVVREDGSGPAEEGTGGDAGAEAAPNLDAMTKAELMDHADSLGVEYDPESTKADIRAAIQG